MTKKELIKELKEREELWREKMHSYEWEDMDNYNICRCFYLECQSIREMIERELH